MTHYYEAIILVSMDHSNSHLDPFFSNLIRSLTNQCDYLRPWYFKGGHIQISFPELFQ